MLFITLAEKETSTTLEFSSQDVLLALGVIFLIYLITKWIKVGNFFVEKFMGIEFERE